MKRLTVRIDGSAYCLGRYQNKHCNVKRCGSCEINDEIIKKLADYEDTGMTPEQVIEMQMDWVAMKAAYSRWIPVTERLPEDEHYVLVSFGNSTNPDIARYEEDGEGGAFYPGDDECTYMQYGLFVNAWMPLPEPYMEGVNANNNKPKRR